MQREGDFKITSALDENSTNFFLLPNSALGLYFEARSLSLGVSSHFNDTCFHWHKPFRELRKICALVFRLCGACCLGGDEKDRIEF